MNVLATIQKRLGTEGSTSFRVMIRRKGFPPEYATFNKISDAKAWAQKTESDMKAGRHFGISKRHTFNDLADEYEPHCKSKDHLQYWKEIFGNLTLDSITPSLIAKQRDVLLNKKQKRFATPATGNRKIDAKREKAKLSGSTVVRYLANLSVTINFAVKTLQWLEKNPCEQIKKPAVSKGRVRFLSDDERATLLEVCKPHDDLYLAVVLALSTGARKAEIMTMRYDQVDFDRKVITLHKTKNGEVRSLPLVGTAFTLLQERAKQHSGHHQVFPPSKKAEKSRWFDLRKQWEHALKDSDIKNFHWHDLRHTAASYMAMSGISLVEISKILGHRTMQMVSRYSHLSEAHIVAAGEKLAARLGI